MADCERAGKFGGCLWQARYDVIAPEAEAVAAVRSLSESNTLDDDDIEALRLLRGQRYVRDICVRCGRTVERDPVAKAPG